MRVLSFLAPLLVLLGSVQAQLTPNMQATVLRAHNQARSKVKPTASNMERMVWNPTLAIIAQEHAENCMWEPNDIRHAEAEHLFPLGVGENMAMNYGGSSIINQNPATFVREWLAEGAFYNHTRNTCEPGYTCNHYLQMMSANTMAVGCGFSICQEMEFFGSIMPLAAFFVCNYGPQGPAITNQLQPYSAGPPCSFCPMGKQLCTENLCEIGMARAPPALSYPSIPMPVPTRIPLSLGTNTPPAGGVSTQDPFTSPLALIETVAPVPTVRVFTSDVGIVNTDTFTGVAPTVAMLPVGAVTEPAAVFTGTMNIADMNCTSPATVFEREQCWLQAWTDWRMKFDSWVHKNCPGP